MSYGSLKKGSFQFVTIFMILATAILLGACSMPEATPAASTLGSETATPAAVTAVPPSASPTAQTVGPTADPSPADADSSITLRFAQTNLRPDGNRVVEGQGNIPSLSPLDIPLDGPPNWVTAVPWEGGLLWAVVLEDGRTQAFLAREGQVEPYPITPERLPPGMPPLLLAQKGQARILLPEGDFSALSHPVLINAAGDWAYIAENGDLVVQKGDQMTRLAVNAQLDARILVDEKGRLLLHSDPTAEYGHGIMGDELEAGSITLVATEPEVEIVRKIPASEGFVLEGIAPIWTDLNGDGQREIIATRSNASQGAQIVILDEQGDLLAEGPAIGQGGRWRHQLAAGPFGPEGQMELVDLLTPHIGGPVEFFRWQGDQLIVVAGASGYTSHVIGSRNLDMAAAGRFEQSGRLTILLPNQARTEIGGIQHTAEGAEVLWLLPLPGRLVSNIFAVSLEDGNLAVGVGLDNHALRIWQP